MKLIKWIIFTIIVIIPVLLNSIAFGPLLKSQSTFFWIWIWLVTVALEMVTIYFAISFNNWFDSKLK